MLFDNVYINLKGQRRENQACHGINCFQSSESEFWNPKTVFSVPGARTCMHTSQHHALCTVNDSARFQSLEGSSVTPLTPVPLGGKQAQIP